MLTGWILSPDGSWEPAIFFGLGPGMTMADLYRHAGKVAEILEQEGLTVHLIGW